VHYEDNSKQKKRRLPSLLEIALHQFNGTGTYDEIVRKISREVQTYRGQEQDDRLQEQLLLDIKAVEQLRQKFRQRHKYIAIVQADGDGIGKLIASLGGDPVLLQGFSTKLMTFTQKAASTIADFGAFPVYIGGDDLLFVSPVVNAQEQSVLTLLEDLQTAFQAAFSDQAATVSLSYGLSISYYKHPLEEALNKAYKLLRYQAKELETTTSSKETRSKNALAFYLETHSGQGFGANLHQKGAVYTSLLELCQLALGQEPGWLSGLTYRLRLLGPLLEHAHQKGTLSTFFQSHFNELMSNAEKRSFLGLVQDLVGSIYDEYPNLTVSEEQLEENFTPQTELLYSILRFAQFFNALDHE